MGKSGTGDLSFEEQRLLFLILLEHVFAEGWGISESDLIEKRALIANQEPILPLAEERVKAILESLHRSGLIQKTSAGEQ